MEREFAVVDRVLIENRRSQHFEQAKADEEDGQDDCSHINFNSEIGENGTLGLHSNTSFSKHAKHIHTSKYTNSKHEVQLQSSKW